MALTIRAKKSPMWRGTRERDGYQTLPSWTTMLRICNRIRSTKYLVKKGESMGILSLKAHLTWAGFSWSTNFTSHTKVLAAVPPALSLGTSLFCGSSSVAHFCLPCYSARANSPDRFMFLSYIPDNKSEVDISYYVIYKHCIFIKL